MAFPNPIVEVAFNNGSDETLYATQGWAEITPWVKSMSGLLRGRSYEVDRTEAGTVTAVLDNTDGEFIPGNAASPFYPNIKANRRFRVRGKNMATPNIARGGGTDHSTRFFERPTWSPSPSQVLGVSDPVWVQHDPSTLPALPAELTDHIEVTVAGGTYSGFRRLLSWLVPVEVGVRLAHSAYIWQVSGTEPGSTEGRVEIFYFDNDDTELIGDGGFGGLSRPMERYTGGTPNTPTRKAFSHAPIGTTKYARVTWSIYYGEGVTIASPIRYGITGIQTELPANVVPNPNGDWDAMQWAAQGGSQDVAGYDGFVGFTWDADAVALYQPAPHLTPGEFYAVTAEVNMTPGHPDVQLTGDEGATGPVIAARPLTGSDDYSRTETDTWGTSTSGHTWLTAGSAPASSYLVASNGKHSIAAISQGRYSVLDIPNVVNFDTQVDFNVPVSMTGAGLEITLMRFYDATNYLAGEAVINPGGTVTQRMRVASVFGNYTIASETVTGLTFTPGTWYRLRFRVVEGDVRVSVHPTSGQPTWLSAEDTWFQDDPGKVTVRSMLQTGNTNTLPVVVSYDAFEFTKLDWVEARTYFQAARPEHDIAFIIPDGAGDPVDTELLVRGLNVQRVDDPSIEIDPEELNPSGETAYERPKDIFEGWIERWPWRVDEDETTIVAVDRLKRVGAIELANVVMETLLQDVPALVIPMNDDPANFNGSLTWQGEWPQMAESTSLPIVSTKGDLLTASYTLGIEGPTEEPGMTWAPASPTVGYHLRPPFSSDFGVVTPPPPTTPPPPSAPPPTGGKTYTKTYYATWSRSYDSDGSTRWDDTPYLYHGCYFCSNNHRSLVGFNWAAIKADLAGASIVSMYFTMKNAHARWNRGLDVNIGYHNYSSKPSTWSSGTVSESKWKVFFKEMEKRSIGIPLYVGDGFKAGTVKGFAIGPAPSDITDNYGYFYGATHSAKPYITITYK